MSREAGPGLRAPIRGGVLPLHFLRDQPRPGGNLNGPGLPGRGSARPRPSLYCPRTVCFTWLKKPGEAHPHYYTRMECVPAGPLADNRKDCWRRKHPGRDLMETLSIKVGDIEIGERHRALSADAVQRLAVSMKELGLRQPI